MGKSSANIYLTLSDEAPQERILHKFQFSLTKMHNTQQSLVVFSQPQLTGESSHCPPPLTDIWLVTDDDYPLEPQAYMLCLIKPLDVDAAKKLRMEGTINQKGECRPIVDDNYMSMTKRKILKASEPQRIAKQLNTVVQSYKPVSDHKHNIEYEMKKKAEGKKSREDKEKVHDMLFAAFEKHQYYNVKDLEKITKQPVHSLAKSGALGLPEAKQDERDLLRTIKTQCPQEWKSNAAHDWYRARGTNTGSVLPREQQSLISRLKSGHLPIMTFQNGCKRYSLWSLMEVSLSEKKKELEPLKCGHGELRVPWTDKRTNEGVGGMRSAVLGCPMHAQWDLGLGIELANSSEQLHGFGEKCRPHQPYVDGHYHPLEESFLPFPMLEASHMLPRSRPDTSVQSGFLAEKYGVLCDRPRRFQPRP
ncbi:GTF2F2 [Cordylochernes scorpioides]|uniref:GTF2F2 n=1 Tax=Cordylochernes scorpioides TaxID=51811 RepID=A0ABY6LGV1_9ARAC|nr:GTF2F2 [Cordylochernes scorpioides]